MSFFRAPFFVSKTAIRVLGCEAEGTRKQRMYMQCRGWIKTAVWDQRNCTNVNSLGDSMSHSIENSKCVYSPFLGA